MKIKYSVERHPEVPIEIGTGRCHFSTIAFLPQAGLPNEKPRNIIYSATLRQ